MECVFEIMKTTDGYLLRLLATGERRGLLCLLIFTHPAVIDTHPARGILLEKFGIVRRGFGRGINVTPNSVVLISNVQKQHGQFVYHDKWEEGRYVYSGEGQTGNQIMSAGNMAILNADRDGKVIHLLIKYSSKEYIYQGIFGLVKHYFKDEADANGRIRKEIKFVLERKSFGD